MTPRGGPAGPPSQREGIKLTLSLITEPPHLAESLALALVPRTHQVSGVLDYDQNVTMNLTGVMSEVISRYIPRPLDVAGGYISMVEETPCKVLITDLGASLT